jgi:hypothetical protein
MMKKLLLLALAQAALFASLSVDEIVNKVDTRDEGDNGIGTMKMILIDKHKNKRVRDMKKYSKNFGEDIYSGIFFLSPSDVKNTAFLTYDYDDGAKDDDQWLYLPALKKTKRIASSKLVKESKVGAHKVWVIESKPKTQITIDETGYTKSYMFVRQDNFVVTRALHFMTDGGKKKYMDVKKLEKIDGIWVATEIEMKTKKGKQTLHATILKFNDVKFNQNLNDNFFTVRQIEKGI